MRLRTVTGGLETLGGTTMPLDPQLRDFGANPGRESLRVLSQSPGILRRYRVTRALSGSRGTRRWPNFGDQVSLTGPEKNEVSTE